MTDRLSTLGLRHVRRDHGEAPDDEVVVLIDDADGLAFLGRSPAGGAEWMGRDPRNVLVAPSPLAATVTPRDAVVARCSCGFESCDALVARVARVGTTVVWEHFRGVPTGHNSGRALEAAPLVFDADQYDRALAGHAVASAWEPTTRRAAVLATELVLRADLVPSGLRVRGFSFQGDVAIVATGVDRRRREPGLVRLRFSLGVAESAEQLATRAVEAVVSGTALFADRIRLGRRRPAVSEDSS